MSYVDPTELARPAVDPAGLDPAKLDESLRQTFAADAVPFCHDPEYRLKASDRWLCKLSDVEQQRCPGFKQACSRKETAGQGAAGSKGKRHDVHRRNGPESYEGEEGQHDKESRTLHVPGWLGMLAEGLFWVLIGAVVVAIGVALYRMRQSRRDLSEEAEERRSLEPGNVPVPPATLGDKDVARLLDKARKAAERGDVAAAIDAAHAAAVQGLSAAGHVEVDRDRTNGDYLRELRKAPPIHRDFKAIVNRVEVAQFGGGVPPLSAFDELLQQVLGLLRRLAVLSLFVLSLFALASCGSGRGDSGGGNGDDGNRGLSSSDVGGDVSPSGLYVLRRLLSDQATKVHVRVSKLTQFAPQVGVIVVYGTKLEDAEKIALLAWVRGGGSLVAVGGSQFLADAELDYSDHPCGNVAGRGPDRELSPLKLAVMGRRTLRLLADEESAVSQRVEVACGGKPYVVTSYVGDGSITVLPEAELLTNAALSVGDNARLVAELLARPQKTLELVGPWTGEGSQSPIQSLMAAGLVPLMLQLFGLAGLLALRQGTSFGKRREVKSVTRRAFADHVRAVASNYARAKAGRLASGHYALLLVDQLRERLCPGQTPTLLQLAAVVARRTQRPENQVIELLVEAKTALEHVEGDGVNHKLIRELELLSAQAGGIS